MRGRTAVVTGAGSGIGRALALDFASKGCPVAIAMAGGYARNIGDTVDIHLRTVRLAREMLADN